MRNKTNSKMKNKLKTGLFVLLGVVVLFALFEIYVPKSLFASEAVIYNAQKGMGDDDIAADLKKQGIIKSSLFFKLYALVSGQHSKLQAGLYNFSPSMSIAGIINKLSSGDVAKQRLVIQAGWNTKDIGKYLEGKGFYTQKNFVILASSDLSKEFSFLKNKPKDVGLEGYIFPDTYNVPLGTSTEDLLRIFLKNFDKKLTLELRKEIAKQNKSIFQVITMASILEKEVRSTDDKKIVAGILWKRMNSQVPLQVDATINYITGKRDVAAKLADKKIDSLYNTYKYLGLPKGPISSPGLESILAAIYPTKSDYWFYLSAKGSGKTIYSKTYKEHNIAILKYIHS